MSIQRKTAMRKAIALLTATTVGFVIVGAPTLALAVTKQSTYEAKMAQCQREAKAKHFGIHFNQRDRWIIKCITR